MYVDAGMRQPGFAPNLIHALTADPTLDEGSRQLLAVLLKRYVERHWVAGESLFQPPEAADADKQSLRAALLASLKMIDSTRVRTAVCATIAAIVERDWPEAWPEFVPHVTHVLQSRPSPAAVEGAARCLAIVSEDLDDLHLPQLMRALLPDLLSLTAAGAEVACGEGGGGGGGGGPPSVNHPTPTASAHALAAAGNMMRTLSHMIGKDQRSLRDHTSSVVAGFLTPIRVLLSVPVPSPHLPDTEVVALQLEALRFLAISAPMYARCDVYFQQLPGALMGSWSLFAASLPRFEALVIRGEGTWSGSDTTRVDTSATKDLTANDVTMLAMQNLDVMLTLVGSPRLARLVASHLSHVVAAVGRYAQISDDQSTRWVTDPNQLLGNDATDGTGQSIRGAADIFIEEVSTQFKQGGVGLGAVAGAVDALTTDAVTAQQRGEPTAWRLREAAFTVVGAVGELIRDLAVTTENTSTSSTNALPPTLTPRYLAETLLRQELALDRIPCATGGAAVLVTRALWLLARLGDALPCSLVDHVLEAAVMAVESADAGPRPDVSSHEGSHDDGLEGPEARRGVLLAGGLLAVAHLLPRAASGVSASVFPRLYPSIRRCLLDETVSGEDKEWVLQTIAATVRSAPSALVPFEADLAPAILGIWWSHANDPMVAPSCEGVLADMVAVPEMQVSLLGRCLGSLRELMLHPSARPDAPPNIQEAAADLTATLLRKVKGHNNRSDGGGSSSTSTSTSTSGQIDVTLSALHDVVFEPAVVLATSSADAGVTQSGVELVRLLVRRAGTRFPERSGLAGRTSTQCVLEVLEKLLSPSGDEASSVFAGNLLCQLLSTLPHAIGPVLSDVLRVLVARLRTASMPIFITGLVNAVARLVHLAGEDVLHALRGMEGDGGGNEPRSVAPTESGLSLVLRLWTLHQNDIQGSYNIKVALSALMKIFSTQGLIEDVVVPGVMLDRMPGRIRTRSRARAAGAEEWTQVPVRLKILMLLADALREAREQQGRRGMRGFLNEDLDDEDDDDWESIGDDDATEEGEDAEAVDAGGLRDGLDPLGVIDLLQHMGDDGDFAGDDDDDDLIPLLADGVDPMGGMDVMKDVVVLIQGVAREAPDQLQAVAGQLTPAQKAAIEAAIAGMGGGGVSTNTP